VGTTTLERPALEVADVLREYGDRYRRDHPVSPEQSAVMTQLARCRTAALGGHRDTCTSCGHVEVSYNSCRNRHCPKCQGQKRAAWLESRLDRLLPCEYFHVVFTLPEELNPLCLRNKSLLYEILFDAASKTLLEIAADPRHLGAQIGFTTILHTWGQNLLLHPHLHCVVTGGGLAPDGTRWVASRSNFFLSVRVLGRLFRGKFLAALDDAYRAKRLDLGGSVALLEDPATFRHLLDALHQKEWVVYAKPPFGGAEHVFRYLGRYTHRVAISNSRLVSIENGNVSFRFKDYAEGCRTKVMRLSADEFIRRFLLHVIPLRFVRIRHYGILAGRNVHTKLECCRKHLSSKATTASRPAEVNDGARHEALPSPTSPKDDELRACSQCGGRDWRREILDRSVGPPRLAVSDTS
jgi:putative transposase/transposase-like zinc-binding protein